MSSSSSSSSLSILPDRTRQRQQAEQCSSSSSSSSSSRPAEASSSTTTPPHHEFAIHWNEALANPNPEPNPSHPPPLPSAIRTSWSTYISASHPPPLPLSISVDPELASQMTAEVAWKSFMALEGVRDAGFISAETWEAYQPLYSFLNSLAEKLAPCVIEQEDVLVYGCGTPALVRATREVARVVVAERWVWPLIGVGQDQGISLILRLRWFADVLEYEDDALVTFGEGLSVEAQEHVNEVVWGRGSKFWRRCQGAAEVEAVGADRRSLRMPTRAERRRPVVVREDDGISRNWMTDMALDNDMVDASDSQDSLLAGVVDMIDEGYPDDVENVNVPLGTTPYALAVVG